MVYLSSVLAANPPFVGFVFGRWTAVTLRSTFLSSPAIRNANDLPTRRIDLLDIDGPSAPNRHNERSALRFTTDDLGSYAIARPNSNLGR